MNKPTPGPWTRDHDAVCANDQHIASAIGPDGCSYEERVANAHLVSAAPDMLEALEFWFDSTATPKQIADRARAAIAKAIGNAPDVVATVDRQQMLADILCTAFEGGIGYWCLADHVTRDAEGNYLALVDCMDVEDHGTKFGDVTLATIRLGIERIISGAIPIRADLLEDVARSWASNEGDCDADAADCIVQAGLLNNITYG